MGDSKQVTEMYEIVYINYCDLYFTVGLFFTLDEAMKAIKDHDDSGHAISEDAEESERIEVVRYKLGFGYNLRHTIKEITRTESEGVDDDIVWITTLIEDKD